MTFVKMTGAGNDFVLVDNRNARLLIDWTVFARAACDRRHGVGADGLLVIERSSRADFMMNYYNADGSYGGMCGNGGRCAARYVIEEANYRSVRFEALGYIYRARELGDSISLRMKNPNLLLARMKLPFFKTKILFTWIDTGAPHAVMFLEEVPPPLRRRLAQSDINAIGRSIRSHRRFAPQGTNVDFIELIDDSTISMRTYERGVENETLACGTGAVASAVVSAQRFGLRPPIAVNTRSGEVLTVSFRLKGEKVSRVDLTGSARRLFSGRLKYDASIGKILA
ncbi:MAG: diaminopimelate epimerase [Bacteroidota bacterium]|jgi:diaminopimelate epimerase